MPVMLMLLMSSTIKNAGVTKSVYGLMVLWNFQGFVSFLFL